MGHLKCLMFGHQTKCYGDLPRCGWEEVKIKDYFSCSETPGHSSIRTVGLYRERCLSGNPNFCDVSFTLGDKLTFWIRCLTSPLPWRLFLTPDSCCYKQTAREHFDKWSQTRILCFSAANKLGFHKLLRGPWVTGGQACPSSPLTIPVAPRSQDLRGQMTLFSAHIPSCQGTLRNK